MPVGGTKPPTARRSIAPSSSTARRRRTWPLSRAIAQSRQRRTTTVDPHLEALHDSADRLRRLVTPLDDDQIERQAYPTKWRVADVMSHLGSGAVITSRRLDDGLQGTTMP